MANCCAPLADASGNALPYGACATYGAGGVSACRCAAPDECSTGYCGPWLNASMNPVGPNVCVPDDCQPYHGCSGFGSCPGGYCDMCDVAGNCLCMQQCSNDSMCGAARCATVARSNGACAGTQPVCVVR